MNAASVRKWCTKFRNGRTDVHDAERSGRPSVITDALKQKVNRIFRENRHFTISEVYEQCPELSRTVVYEIVTEHLRYRKICARWSRRLSGTRREQVNWCHGTTSASMSKVTLWRSRWRCVIKPAYSFSFLLSINIFVWQNVLYFPNDLRTIYNKRVGTLIVAIFIYNWYKIDACFEVLLSFNVVTSIVYNPLPAMWKS